MNRQHADSLRPMTRPRLYEQVAQQITEWVTEAGIKPGDKLPPERELAQRLGVSRATLSQALVALEVVGAVAVRHGDGTVLTDGGSGSRLIEALRAHAKRLPEIIEARDALETKLAALAATRRTPADLKKIDAALTVMETDIDGGGRGVEGDELFHAAVTAAARSPLLAKLMGEISDLIIETRIESLAQPGRPHDSLKAHRKIRDAIEQGAATDAADAMHAHIEMVSDVALVRD